LINDFDPGIILLQEHWLTSANLSKFDDLFDDYFCFGESAMLDYRELLDKLCLWITAVDFVNQF